MTLKIVLLALLLPTSALAAEVEDEPDSNVTAERVIDAAPDDIYAVLADTERMAQLAPDRCMRKWQVAPDGSGFRVVYLVEAFRRKLDARVQRAEPGRRLEWDHLGNKGFVSRFTLKAVPEQEDPRTTLRLVTYVAAPGWPLRRYYHNKVKPAWKGCYEELLEAVDREAVRGGPG